MESVTNIFACLVHENLECVIDLLRNLKYFDPSSPILLYDGSARKRLLPPEFPFERYHATLVPESKSLPWGRLHDFALDCFQFAIRTYEFVSLTIVDSDQLLIRHNYSDFIKNWLQDKSRVGLLGSSEKQFGNQTSQFVTRIVNTEIDLWRSFVERFEGDPGRFVRWSFWPATVFTYSAVQDIVKVAQYEPRLREILSLTRVHATEEVIFPTLVNLLGYEIQENPCNFQFIRYRVTYTPETLQLALRAPNAYWLHPVVRQYDEPLRKAMRAKFKHYVFPSRPVPPNFPLNEKQLFLTLPILREVEKVEGWLEEEEADLLIALIRQMVAQLPAGEPGVILDVGSYCGKATITIGLTLKMLQETRVKIYSIDSHDGKVGALDQGIMQSPPTFEKFSSNIHEAGIESLVEPIKARPSDVMWNRPIDLLLIDSLHDYPSVAADFFHFACWIKPGALVAFHDYADYYPGVMGFVDELIGQDDFRLAKRVKSLVILERKAKLQPSTLEDHPL
jgi:hypothetical protein